MSDVQRVLRGISAGTLLRIERIAGGKAEGKLRESHADAVTIANGEILERISFLEITAVWRRATFALPGALIGAVAGLGLGILVTMKAFALLAGFLVGKVLLIAVLVLIGLGALFGGALGAWLPRWVKVWG
jgi:hypothetical protein